MPLTFLQTQYHLSRFEILKLQLPGKEEIRKVFAKGDHKAAFDNQGGYTLFV